MCKKIFSMEARNERLAKKLARKEARAEHKKLKRELVEADLYIRDADSELYNMKRDFKVLTRKCETSLTRASMPALLGSWNDSDTKRRHAKCDLFVVRRLINQNIIAL